MAGHKPTPRATRAIFLSSTAISPMLRGPLVAFAPDDGDPPAVPPAPAPAPAPTPAPKEPETFSREYVTELRNENRGWRLKATEQEQRAQAATDEAKRVKEEAETAKAAALADAETVKTTAQKTADDRIIRAELRTAAVKAGMVDLDGLKLADLSTVKLNDAGEVEGADALMTALKEAKPYLFGEAKPGSSNPDSPPSPKPNTAKKASEMTDAEWREAQRRIDSGKGIAR